MTNEEPLVLHVFEAPSDLPLLQYAFSPVPNPLRASRPAALTLVVSNAGRQIVTVTSIAVTLPVGTTAKTLIADAAGIGMQRPSGWNVAISGGILTFTPATPADGNIGANGLVFEITGLTINDQPGTCFVPILEQASSPGAPFAARTQLAELVKFPATFTLSEISLSATNVPAGGSAVLSWTGSPATYTLGYDPDGHGTRTVANPASPFIAQNLNAPLVVFTLTASITVPGSDQPFVTQRKAFVQVSIGAITYSAYPRVIGANGVVKLSWNITGTSAQKLTPGNIPLPPTGTRYVVIPRSQTVSFVATETGTGRELVEPIVFTVDPTIVATEAPIVKTGPNGGPGDPGQQGVRRSAGGPGGRGGPVPDFTVDLGPLSPDSPPARVVRIQATSGAGGPGGPGGALGIIGLGAGGPGGNGGSGGTGTVRLNPALPPQQLIVDLRAGPGGEGGSGNPPGPPGHPGSPPVLVFIDVPRA